MKLYIDNREPKNSISYLESLNIDFSNQLIIEIKPLEIGFQNRKYIYQLYPLLVHLVLFGSGYYSDVIRIVKKYS